MLDKGRAASVRVFAVVGLAISLAIPLIICTAADATNSPAANPVSVQHDALGRVRKHVYIGHSLPPRPSAVSTQQGSGPDPDTNLTENATGTPEVDPSAAPSRLTNRLVFASKGEDENDDGLIDPTVPEDADYNIWMMRPDGSEQIQLTDQEGDELAPVYSPGTNRVAFAGNQTGTWQIYAFEVRDRDVIWCLTDRQTPECDRRHPTWSPDGRFIAYQANPDGNWDIYSLLSTGNADEKQLTTSTADDTDPAWVTSSNSPGSLNGNAIAYTASVGNVTRIQRVDADTGSVDALTNGGGQATANDRDPAWSKDGNYLAFASDRLMSGDVDRDYNIFRSLATGEVTSGVTSTAVANLDTSDTTADLDPTWAPPSETNEPMRIMYESQRSDASGAEEDIWATVYEDIDPPQLDGLPFTTTGNARAPEERLFLPGSDVYFHVKVYDEDSGVDQVFVGIKDPNVKVYNPPEPGRFWGGDREWGDPSGAEGYQFREYDYQRIASVELYDDGNPDHGDAVADDGMFGGKWTVPDGYNSDFVIDTIVYDNATPQNMQNYDSLHGFTSKRFNPAHNVLFVNDYCEGQHFIHQLGYDRNNDEFASYYTESFYLYNPSWSPFVEPGQPPVNTTQWYGNDTDFHSIGGYAERRGVSLDDPDVWRILCRGPVPASVCQYYLPTTEFQLAPQEAVENPETASPTREVPVAPRAIIWACPHAGDVWIGEGSGSLLDAQTQADLALFLDRGGRLMISGMDIAWALTMNGEFTNSFLQDYLKATFVQDSLNGLGDSVAPAGAEWSVQGRSGDPVTTQLFGHYRNSDEYPLELNVPAPYGTQHDTHHDCHDFSWYPDVIQEAAGSGVVKLYGYNDYDGRTAGLRYVDPSTTARLVYLAFGFESIHRGYHTINNVPHCKNKRSHLIHNFLCWARTGGFRGKVVAIDDGKPITGPNPIVYVWQGSHATGDRDDPPDFAVRCQDDGRYRIQGVPGGSYTLEATRPGYAIDKYDGIRTHGGWPPFELNFAITRTRPGGVAGTVTSEANDDPLTRVVIAVYPVPEEDGEEDQQANGAGATTINTAQGAPPEPDWDELEPVTDTETPPETAVDGTYNIGDLPPGDYYVRADGSDIGFGDAWQTVTITAGNVSDQDFTLGAADGTLVVEVVDSDTDQTIENALVQVENGDGEEVASSRTDNTGSVQFSLQPGTYTVYASAAGYERSSGDPAQVRSLETKTVRIEIEPGPGAELVCGSIISETTGEFKGDVQMQLLTGGEISKTTISQGTAIAGIDSQCNYVFYDVPAGTVTVRPRPQAGTAVPDERQVNVTSGARETDVNFTLKSLHVFPDGLHLISAPYDYDYVGDGTPNDPAKLLGVPRDKVKLATWQPLRDGSSDGASVTGRYRYYPQAPADRIRLGKGYWIKLEQRAPITRKEDVATDPFELELKQGWNLVGDPYEKLMDFYAVEVIESGMEPVSMQQALADGLIEGTMFAYVLGGYQNTAVFNPWTATWINAGQDVTLRFSKTAGALDTAANAAPPVPQPENGWLATIRTEVGGLVDASTHFGMSQEASAGYDTGIDMSKPPKAEMGPYVYTAFTNPEWGSRSGNYSVDVRSSGAGKEEWNLRVETGRTDAPVTLRWPDLSKLPADSKPVLKDRLTGDETYMRTSCGYTFTSTGGARRFKICVDRTANAALSVTGVSAQAIENDTFTIAYTLSEAAAVNVTVLNMAGRIIDRVVADDLQSAGANAVTWDACSNQGTKVPAGRYLVRIMARSESGQSAQIVHPLTVGY